MFSFLDRIFLLCSIFLSILLLDLLFWQSVARNELKIKLVHSRWISRVLGIDLLGKELFDTIHAFLLNDIWSSLWKHTYLERFIFGRLNLACTIVLILDFLGTHSYNRCYRVIMAVKSSKVDLLLMQAVKSLTDLWVSLHILCKDWICYLLDRVPRSVTIHGRVASVERATTRSRAKTSPSTLKLSNFKVCTIHLASQFLIVLKML